MLRLKPGAVDDGAPCEPPHPGQPNFTVSHEAHHQLADHNIERLGLDSTATLM
jgi:hypothetical protein